MTNDLYNKIATEKAIEYQQVTGAVTGETIDTQGYQSIMFSILLAAVATADGSNYLTITLYEGDASDMSDESAVAAAYVQGSAVINNTALANTIKEIGYTGYKRYLRLKIAETGTADASMSAIAIKGDPLVTPA